MLRFENRKIPVTALTLTAALVVSLLAVHVHAQSPAAPADKAAPAAAAAAGDAPAKSDAAVKDATPANESPVVDEPTHTGPLAPLAWLNGCWKGNVGVGGRLREFREYWHPLRGNLMVGVGHNALADRTISFEHLRLEPRGTDVYYVAGPGDKPPVAFKLAETRRDGKDEIFTFRTGGTGFPTYITYRRASLGWLYVEVGGRVTEKGAERDHKVTYPYRRVDCETGEFIKK